MKILIWAIIEISKSTILKQIIVVDNFKVLVVVEKQLMMMMMVSMIIHLSSMLTLSAVWQIRNDSDNSPSR
jgi:hypothetical protein